MGQRNVMQGLLSRVAVGVFALLTIAMILLAIFDDRGALALRERRGAREILGADVQGAEQQNEKLRGEIQDLRHNPDAIERRAREHLNLVKQDEIILQLPESKTPSPSETSAPTTPAK